MRMIFWTIVTLVLVAGGTFVWLFDKEAGAIDDKIVRMGAFTRAMDFGVYFIALEKGWFEEAANKHGYRVVYTEFQTLAPINESLATDKLDLVAYAEAPFLVGASAGIDVKIAEIIGTHKQQVMVHKDSDIHAIADFKNKKVAALSGSSAHYLVSSKTKEAGLTDKDFTFIDLTPLDAQAAFVTDQIDVWAIWPPHSEQLEVSGAAKPVPGWATPIPTFVGARQGFVSENPELYGDLMAAMEKARVWFHDNEEEALKFLAEYCDVDLPVAQLFNEREDFNASISPEIVSSMQKTADFLHEKGFIKNSVNAEDAFMRTDY